MSLILSLKLKILTTVKQTCVENAISKTGSVGQVRLGLGAVRISESAWRGWQRRCYAGGLLRQNVA